MKKSANHPLPMTNIIQMLALALVRVSEVLLVLLD